MENKTNWWKISTILLIAGIIFFSGFSVGKKSAENGMNNVPAVEYYTDTVRITVDSIKLVKEEIDTCNFLKNCIKKGIYEELFPEKVKDSIIYVYLEKQDSDAIVNDWQTKRTYEKVLFNNDLGKAEVSLDVVYNRLDSLRYTFVPYATMNAASERLSKLTKKPEMFIGAGITSHSELMLQGGVFFNNNTGLSLIYEYDWDNKIKTVGINYLYKFKFQ